MGKTKMKRTEAGSGNLKEHFKRNWPYYVMMLPGIIYLVMFKYIPMLGSVIAFKDYSAYKGIWDSAWCGLTNFKKLFTYPGFLQNPQKYGCSGIAEDCFDISGSRHFGIDVK